MPVFLLNIDNLIASGGSWLLCGRRIEEFSSKYLSIWKVLEVVITSPMPLFHQFGIGLVILFCCSTLLLIMYCLALLNPCLHGVPLLLYLFTCEWWKPMNPSCFFPPCLYCFSLFPSTFYCKWWKQLSIIWQMLVSGLLGELHLIIFSIIPGLLDFSEETCIWSF